MSVPGPVLGPCEPWIDGADIEACCTADAGSAGAAAFDQAALDASAVLYEASGRMFSGLCRRTVRPCRDRCGCWGPSTGFGPWFWTTASYGIAPAGWSWRNECGDRCGCGSLSTVRLAGYPVREILEVKIGGDVLPALDGDGNPNYRLDGWRDLVRLDDPGPPVVTRQWPACQNLSLDDDQPGTFSVEYRWGTPPPHVGELAAAELACEIFKACNGVECELPKAATKVVRQGVEVERRFLLNWFDPTKPTGLINLDLFLKGYWSTVGRRRPAVYSPDVQPFARRLGGL